MEKYILVTGATGGIGNAIAMKLADAGYSLILMGRNEEALNNLLNNLSGKRHLTWAGDIRDKPKLLSFANELSEIKLSGIIANAGIGGENTFEDKDRWNEIIETNLTGTYLTVNSMFPLLVSNSEPFKQVIIISSILARLGVAGYSAYCASKAGLLGLMRSWAIEWAPQGILVNAICPGWVKTKMSEQGMQGIADKLGVTTEEFFDIAMQSVPLKKMSSPSEIADLVHWMLTQQSITGQTIDINNGAIMNS